MNKKREKSNNDASHHKTLPLDRQAVIDDTKDADVEHHTTEILVYANGPCNKTPRVGWNPPMSALNQVTYSSERSDEESKCDKRYIFVSRIANGICCQGEE